MIVDVLLARLGGIPQVERLVEGGDFALHLPQEIEVANPTLESELPQPQVNEGLPLASMPLGVALRESEVLELAAAEVVLPSDIERVALEEPVEEQELPALDVETVLVQQPITLQTLPLMRTMLEPVEAKASPSIELPAVEEVQPEHKLAPKAAVKPSQPMPIAPITEALPDVGQSIPEPQPKPEIEPTELELVQPQVAKPNVPPLVRNVIERMQELDLEPGKTKIVLKPQGLGTLEIDLTQASDGQIQLIIRAENPIVLEALRQENGALSSLMGAKGFDLAGGEAQLGQYQRPQKQQESSAEEVVEAESDETQQLGVDGLNIMT